MTKTIIVPLDGSPFAERALAPARTLAQQSGASVLLLMSRLGGATEPEASLQAAAERNGVDSPRIVVFSDLLAATAIPMVAETEPEPLICMSTHGRSGAGLTLFGSIAESVLRSVDIPVVLVGPAVTSTPDQKFEEVIACLDGSEHADAILPHALGVSRDIGADLWLVFVGNADWNRDARSALDAEMVESSSLRRAARTLEDDDVKVNWETLHGSDPAAAIVDFAKSFESPLIAMTTHGRTGLARVVAGSVTMSVVHCAPCPVLVTRSHSLEG